MFYITGDIHGYPDKLIEKIEEMELTENDTVIILGDAGFNFFLSDNDELAKRKTKRVPCKFFCIQGNHEGRPHHLPAYHQESYCGGMVWVEDKYPNLLFAKDGEVYDFDGYKCLVIGGAYSVDKYWRIFRRGEGELLLNEHYADIAVFARGNTSDLSVQRFLDKMAENAPYGCYGWFNDEQISGENKKRVEKAIEQPVDFVFSHTCPFHLEPIDMFLPQVDQSTVDTSTEEWLDTIWEKTDFEKWFCGHWHTDRTVGKLRFLYHDIIPLISND